MGDLMTDVPCAPHRYEHWETFVHVAPAEEVQESVRPGVGDVLRKHGR